MADPFAAYVTTDDPFAAFTEKPVHPPPTPVDPDEPDTWMVGFVKGLKEQFSPREVIGRAGQGAQGVVQGMFDAVNPMTYVRAAQAAPGVIRAATQLPERIATEGFGPMAQQAGQALTEAAMDPQTVGRFAGAFAAPPVARVVAGGVAGGALRTGKALGKGPGRRLAKGWGGG